jgi:TonB-dependent receptor
MRLKTLALCSASTAILAFAVSPAAAQTDPAMPVDSTIQAQDSPADPDAGSAQTDDAVQSADGADQATGDTEIVVTGLRRSLQSAQNIKRNSDQIVDAIVAEDIGKLPDVTASAALARVTGVQVNRAAGEAAQVQIRGLPDISTTYNGREIFTAENRFVAIQDFPAGAVGALEVFKASTANLIEAGIGGQVNVRSRRPFDFSGFELSGSLNGVLFEQADKKDWNGNLLISNRWDTGIGEVGVLVNFAMTNINFLDSTRENDRYVSPEPNNPVGPGDFRRPNGQGIFYGRGDRWRPSVNGAIQWRPSADLQFYVDGLFQGYRAHDSNHWLFVPTFGATQFSNVVLRQDGSNSAASATVTNAATPDGFDEYQKVRTNTYQFAGGFAYDAGPLRLTGDVAYTDSTFAIQQANIDYAFTSSPVRNVVFESAEGPGGGTFDFLNFDASNPDNYLWRGLFDRAFEATGDDIQARLDAEYETGIDALNQIDVGVRYNDRQATRRNGQRYIGTLGRGIRYFDLPIEGHNLTGFTYDDLQPERTFPQATFKSVFDNIDELRTLTGFPTGAPPFNPLETFEANEENYALYGQARYNFDLGIPVSGTVGLRAVHTKTALTGTSRQFTTTGEVTAPITASNEYWDYLPSISARLEFTPELQLRLAHTETRTRPNFDQLNPGGFLGTVPSVCTPDPDAPNCFRSFDGGNPGLQPLQSKNYDASLEYYFSRNGFASLAFFRRDVSNFIFRTTTTLEIPDAPDLQGNLPVNGGKGRLDGVEAQITTFLDFPWVPNWAQGFGFQANYTYIDAGTELAPAIATQLPGRQPVPNVSKHAYNLVAMYERSNVSARLAYNWRSKFVVEYQNLQQNFWSPLYQDSLGTLDFSASYTPIENVTIAFDFLNILADPRKTYRAYNTAGDTYRFQTIYLERVYSLGVRFRF